MLIFVCLLRWSVPEKLQLLVKIASPEFVLHSSSSWVNIEFQTENQVPRLPGSRLDVD